MNRKRVLALVSGLVAITAAVLLTLVVFPGAAGTGSPGVSAPDVVSAPMVASAAITPAAPETASAPGSPQEGIKVHGSWTIEVRNLDGTLAERREFENAFIGAEGLSNFLSRDNSVGGWYVTLSGTPEAFLNVLGEESYGVIVESSYSSTDQNFFKNLTVSSPDTGDDASKLILSGTATAQRNGQIGAVSVSACMNPSNIAPSSSYEGPSGAFTQTSLSSPVSLSTGQQVSVTVKISFS